MNVVKELLGVEIPFEQFSKPFFIKILESADYWYWYGEKGLFHFLIQLIDNVFVVTLLNYYRPIAKVLGPFSKNEDKWKQTIEKVISTFPPTIQNAYNTILKDAWHKVKKLLGLIETIDVLSCKPGRHKIMFETFNILVLVEGKIRIIVYQ